MINLNIVSLNVISILQWISSNKCYRMYSKTNDMQRRQRPNPATRVNFRHKVEIVFAGFLKISQERFGVD